MRLLAFLFIIAISTTSYSQTTDKLEPSDIFNIENISEPQISHDGQQILYVRNFKDIMTDKNLSNIWVANHDGSDNYPITTGNSNDLSPRWSPNGKYMAFLSSKSGSVQLYLKWLSNGAESKLTNLQEMPMGFSWSPDSKWIAFIKFVPKTENPFITMPPKPGGALWNEPAMYIEKMNYRFDGQGYLKTGDYQLFVLPVEGGTPRQLTSADHSYVGNISWSRDSKSLFVSSNQHPKKDFNPLSIDIFRIDISDTSVTKLTDDLGPDTNPIVSPDGTKIAYLSFEDKFLPYAQNRLHIMNIDGSNSKEVLKIDRDIQNIQWKGNGKSIFFQYVNHGDIHLAHTDLKGNYTDLATDLGGLFYSRPYSDGTYSVASNGNFAYSKSSSYHPADLASGNQSSSQTKRLTNLNDDLFQHKTLGKVEEIWFNSSFDDKKIQGWICTPPDFDPNKKYPLILEIHGGPFASYSQHFASEIQLYAAAGYVVLYTNPRGSTSYGADFANIIHHNYPGEDYDDLMSGVDAVIKKGYVDPERLYITGGSGGGILTAWTVTKTDRFRAAVSAKPVINWYTLALVSDGPGFFTKYWLPGLPWENPDKYMKHSPISYVGNVKTPTMLLTGEEDYRTPMSESEQFYTALKLLEVPAALVRIPNASHGIAGKPSNLITKALYILSWFDKYGEE